MAELERVSALTGHLHSARSKGDAGGVRLSELRPRAIAQVMGAPQPAVLASCLSSHRLEGQPGPGRCVRGDQMRVLWNGPGQYLVVSEQHFEQALTQSLTTALQDHDSAVVDLSHARTVLRLHGPGSADLLAKGCPLDLEGMRPNDAAATVLSHFNILLHCAGEDAFEIYVMRSFGLACFEWLQVAGREFGMSVA